MFFKFFFFSFSSGFSVVLEWFFKWVLNGV